jgi:gluconate 2-dehydrogenase gamma chain
MLRTSVETISPTLLLVKGSEMKIGMDINRLCSKASVVWQATRLNSAQVERRMEEATTLAHRRDVLRMLAAGAGWPVADSPVPIDLFAILRGVHATAQSDGRGTFRSLDAHAAKTLAAACDRLIPTGDSPGAIDAVVTHFIDRILADWYDPDESDRFLAGLQMLDTRSRAANGRPFVRCTVAQQDAMLATFDREVQTLEGDPRERHWFAMLKHLTVWAYCTSEVGMKTKLHLYPHPLKYDGRIPHKGRM